METLGSLIDKLTIEKIRCEKMKGSSVSYETLVGVERKVVDLQSEINSYLTLAVRGEVNLEDPKFKFYKNENASGDVFSGVAEAISRLAEANYTLWNLEDKRRDKTIGDEERLRVCDDVAKWNRIRNDSMDSINKLLHDKINNK
jgi:hypothetical protein